MAVDCEFAKFDYFIETGATAASPWPTPSPEFAKFDYFIQTGSTAASPWPVGNLMTTAALPSNSAVLKPLVMRPDGSITETSSDQNKLIQFGIG